MFLTNDQISKKKQDQLDRMRLVQEIIKNYCRHEEYQQLAGEFIPKKKTADELNEEKKSLKDIVITA